MNKKGFTLVEILSIIVVIGIIAIITISIVSDRVSLTKRKTYDAQVNNIINATKTYMLEEKDLDPNHTNTLCIYVSELQDKEYLKKGQVLNPVTGEDVARKINNKSKGVVIVKFDYDTNQYTYNFTTEGCTEIIITPAYQTILDNEDIKTSGNEDGLYEENNEYVFKGDNPNNYIKFKGGTWRIVSIDKETNMIKIVKLSSNPKSLSENKVDGLINDLNEEFNADNSLYNDFKEYINQNSKWNIGNVSSIDSIISLKTQERQSNDYKTIGLLSISDYINASIDNNCFKGTCSSYLSTSSNYWLLNKASDDKNWYVKDDNTINNIEPGDQLYNVYPVLYLKPSVSITSGNGGSNDNDQYVSR